jgi:hypothetical protein
MAASPVCITPAVSLRRRPLALTPRRLEANRRNAARSTALRGEPRSGNPSRRVGAERVEEHEDWRRVVEIDSAKTNPPLGIAG